MKTLSFLAFAIILFLLLNPTFFRQSSSNTTTANCHQNSPRTATGTKSPIAGDYSLETKDGNYLLQLDSSSHVYTFVLYNKQTGAKTEGNWELSLANNSEQIVFLLDKNNSTESLIHDQQRLLVSKQGLRDLHSQNHFLRISDDTQRLFAKI